MPSSPSDPACSFAKPESGADGATLSSPLPESASPVSAPEGYEILTKLGQGGMGVVYQARQVKLNRVVALKMILAGNHARPEDVRRFLVEAEAVARLQHPNIVQIFESGQHAGLPFFTLELVAGGTLAERVRQQPLAAGEAARLLEALARGVASAHARGILHRDLKPENVLLAADGTPKIADFGLAKRVAASEQLTASGAVMGTPSYMAPEQAGGQGNAVGPRTDVYALGAILYRLVTGRPPFQAASSLETLLQVVTAEPVPPRQLQPQLPHDLETICLTCLHKEPRRRYGSAEALADDLRRFQAGEPIAARPVGRLERGVKWCRRRPAVAGLLAALAALATTALTVIALQYEDVVSERDIARQQEKNARDKQELANRQTLLAQKAAEAARLQKIEADKHAALALEAGKLAQKRADALESALANSNVLLAQNAFHDGNLSEAHALLDRVPAELRFFDWRQLKRQFTGGLFTLFGHTGMVGAVCFSPDGQRLASAGSDLSVKVWDVHSGRELATLRGHHATVTSIAFSPDGQRLASASYDETVRLWNVHSGKELATLSGHKSYAYGVAFSPDGQHLALACYDRTVRLWDARTGKELAVLGGHKSLVYKVAFSPDGQRLASASADHTVKLWDARTGAELATLRGNGDTVFSVAFSTDGQRLASVSSDTTVKLWDARTGADLVTCRGHTKAVYSVAFSPDGQRLASGSWDGTAKLWDVPTGREAATLRGHMNMVNGVAFSPDGRCLASASHDGTVKVWDARTGQGSASCGGHAKPVMSVAFSPDSQRLASASADKTVKFWDMRTGYELATLRGHVDAVSSVAFAADGLRVASASVDNTVKLWDVRSGEELATLRGHLAHVTSVAFSSDGQRLASASQDQTIKLWDARTGAELATLRGHTKSVNSVAFDASDQCLASASSDNTVKLWDARSGAELATLRGHVNFVIGVAFSPDGQRLASASWDNTVKLWDPRNGAELSTLHGHVGQVTSVAFSPDGQRLASASQDQTIKLWDARTGQMLVTLRGHASRVIGLAFSPDGQRLAGAMDQRVVLWDARSSVKPATPGGPLDTWELGYRDWATRFDPSLHREQQAFHGEGNPAAALAHLELLLARNHGGAPAVLQRYMRLFQATAKTPAKPHLWAAFATAALHQGDMANYHKGAAKLLALADGKGTDVALLAARTAVLSREPPADLQPVLATLEQLPVNTRSATDSWIEGGLQLRLGQPAKALPLLERAVAERAGDGPPHAELLLAITCKKLGKAADAKKWLAKAAAWLNASRAQLAAGSAVLAAHQQPLMLWPAIRVQDLEVDPRCVAWGWKTWEELLVLHREAQK